MEEQSKTDCITGIYLITHIATGRPYVGLTGRVGGFEARWHEHRIALQHGSASTHLQRAWNKYGEEAFSFSVHTHIAQGHLHVVDFYKLLAQEEVRILRLFPNNFNNTTAGDIGMMHKPEVRQKLSNTNIEKMKNPEYRAKKIADINSVEGTLKKININKSPRIREARKQQLLVQMKDPELRKKRMTKIHTCESQAKATLGKQKKWQNPEWAAKMKVLFCASGNTPEANKKKSIAAKAHWADPANRKAIGQKSSEMWERRRADPEEYSKFCTNVRKAIHKANEANPELVTNKIKRLQGEEHRRKVSEMSSALWADPVRKAALLEKRKIAMATPEYRTKMAEITRERHRKRRESMQQPS